MADLFKSTFMYVQQIYTDCLSEASYFISSNGEAAIIDPIRDSDFYLRIAKDNNSVIKYIFETHFHADFISGHLELAGKTNATIIFGPATKASFNFHMAADGEEFKIGNISVEAMHTPGHTIESTCYLLKNEQGKPYCIFTGDTLFAGDVGRPDLSSGNLPKEELASILFDSIQNKLMPLDNDIIVYPAHGPGSSCGKNIGPQLQSTIGNEKQTNYAMQPQSKEDFIKVVTSELSEPPAYFSVNAKINKEGYSAMDKIKAKSLQSLTLDEFKEKIKNNTVILDTRNPDDFTNGFIPGSLFIGLKGRFAEWAGSLLPFDKPVVLITEEGKEEETVIRLARVGFENVEGYLAGGFETWKNAGEEIDLVINVEADELAMDIPFDSRLTVVDVRRMNEFAEGHVANAINMPLDEMTDVAQIAQLEEDQNLYVHCKSGYRSVIAASLLKQQGYHNLRNVLGGWSKIKEQKNIKTEKEGTVLN